MTVNSRFTEAVARLHNFFPLDDPDPEDFDDAVACLAALNDRRSIAIVLDLADDGCLYEGLMASLLESLEGFPSEVFVSEFVLNAASLRAKSPEWYGSELRKLLGSTAHREQLTDAIAMLDEATRGAMLSDVARIGERVARLRADAETLVEALSPRPVSS